MDTNTHSTTNPSSELFNAYWKTQETLWDQWMELNRQFVSTLPIDHDPSSPASPLKLLDEQAKTTMAVSKAWLQLWSDSLKHYQTHLGSLTGLDHQTGDNASEARKDLFGIWLGFSRNFMPISWMAPEATQQAFETWEEFMEGIVEVPFSLATTLERQVV